MKSENAAQIP